ncbi:DUF4132 domain-containing protein [Chondrinema litorale]|uniref:DUF4132 domain-containing protein n=1 Tax=Chondrinema litorale TaxID=2994555 RepID=UPI0025435E89|nr:DUF4132 domain-containing protein [Chondrinema litorale]UZR98133.1 DUF4132 domain-containing protein [Chondrinema litorale]
MDILKSIKNMLSDVETTYSQTESEFDKIIFDCRKEFKKTQRYIYYFKASKAPIYNDEIKEWENDKKIEFLHYCINQSVSYFKNRKGNYSSNDEAYEVNHICNELLNHLFRTKIVYSSKQAINMINILTSSTKNSWQSVFSWPVGLFLNQLARQLKNKEVEQELFDKLDELKNKLNDVPSGYYEKDKMNWIAKIDDIYYNSKNGESEIKPVYFVGKDPFQEFANNTVKSAREEDKIYWYQLITMAHTAKGGKPSNKYLKESNLIFKELGAEKFKKTVNEWLVFLYELKEKTTEHTSNYGNREYTYTSTEFLSSVNSDAIKGFVWMCAHFHDDNTLNNISRLAERCFRKIPGKGPAAAAIGNACLFVLYRSKGLTGIGQLSRLKLRIKQANTQKMIDNYLKEAAKTRGISVQEIEDMAVEDFNITDGKKLVQFEDYQAEIEITGIGKTILKWIKPDGAYQKSIPAFAKEKYAAKLKKLKLAKKQIEQTLTAQRDRVDRMFRQNRSWNMENFTKLYFEHGLMAVLSHKIIWIFTSDETEQTGIFIENKWLNQKGEVFQPNENSTVTLWHPANYSVEEVKEWRDFLIGKKFQQPLKQAFREVYILTDAEVNTKSYSNRMAAHVLKQHQFNMLAKTRGWSYALMGAYDDGIYNQSATLQLPEYELRAEYWVNELNADDAFNDTGIWNYITTDQIRFIKAGTDQVLDLVDVPVVPFSEVLRDVDMFVGVASVGNDPAWQDSGGIPAYRDYWTSYSFGDLSEIAKNRKAILTTLIPRLKIGKVAEIKDKFLVVKGKLRTYKIHIGSTNILMEPNDQYLCIVPDRSKKNHTENLFIPFEGDNGLSIILSKAFLLAEDDKIKDSTITSQILWKK